jgi:polyvinyl alcohol dehydrogenase (cytochrome)
VSEAVLLLGLREVGVKPTFCTLRGLLTVSVIFVSVACPTVRAQFSDGQLLFIEHCQSCHRLGNKARAPLPATLNEMSSESILAAMDSGKMKSQGIRLTPEQRKAIAAYLGRISAQAKSQPNPCPASIKENDGTSWPSGATWNGWGVDGINSRFQPASAALLPAEDVPKLKLKWAFGFPHVTTVLGQPAVLGGRVYLGSQGGAVYSLDPRSGCMHWTMQAAADVRTAITSSPDGRILYFGDQQASIYAIEAANGKLLWKKRLDPHPYAMITGSPKLSDGRLYVPVSSLEEVAAGNPDYECCTFRGSVVAVQASNAEQVWKTYTISRSATKTQSSVSGRQRWGPSGAAVWLSPTLDPLKNVLYIGTGDNYSEPPSNESDAILALDRDTGHILWITQVTPQDSWNVACISEDQHNCPRHAGGDFDFGASPILRDLGGGKRVLIAGQKSGVVYGLDPDRNGKVAWQTRVGEGGPLGGIEWGGAADDSTAYFAVSDLDFQRPEAGGGLHALHLETGEKAWSVPPIKPACLGKPGCSRAQSGPVTVIPGAVFSGSMDGHLRAFATPDGHLLWDFDTLQEFETVNGVKAHGGSLNATGAVVAGGMLLVNSGYGRLGLAGNVLLAFSVDGK